MTKDQFINLKQETHEYCEQWVEDKVELLTSALKQTDQANNAEAKSSMGDKYETTRAMLHLEKEKHQAQLAQVLSLRKVLDQINPTKLSTEIGLGTLVETNRGWFYLSIGAGALSISGLQIMAISPVAPLAQELKRQTVGTSFKFQDRDYKIKGIY